MDKIEEVLRYIQDICVERTDDDGCYDCPFLNSSGRCIFKCETPYEWAINPRKIMKYVD